LTDRHVGRLALLAALLVLLPGCAGRQYRPGAKALAAHQPGQEDGYKAAPYPGTYALFRAGQAEPVAVRELYPGAAVGFGAGEDGRMVALAGAQEIPIPEGEYRWHVVRVHQWRHVCLALDGVTEPMEEAFDGVRPLVTVLCVLGVIVGMAGGALLVGAMLQSAGQKWL
jgi:hypothetical protein